MSVAWSNGKPTPRPGILAVACHESLKYDDALLSFHVRYYFTLSQLLKPTTNHLPLCRRHRTFAHLVGGKPFKSVVTEEGS